MSCCQLISPTISDTCEPFSGKWGLTSLPDDKILDWSKLKHIADDIPKYT